MSDFFDAARRQRACRRFDPDRPVDDELVDRILDAARFAPSAENTQPWVFVVVREADTRAALAELMANLWNMAPDRELGEAQLARVQDGFGGGFATAPVWIVVGGDTTATERHSMSSSIFPAVQNLLLGATALGLGSAMTTIATYAPDQVRELTGLPDHVKPMALIPLGWPAKPLGPPNRRPLSEIAHRERYDNPW